MTHSIFKNENCFKRFNYFFKGTIFLTTKFDILYSIWHSSVNKLMLNVLKYILLGLFCFHMYIFCTTLEMLLSLLHCS